MKYLLCRPLGGFNDTLNQIYSCYQYCIKYNRCLLIDTEYNNFISSSFDNYFTFINNNVINIVYNTEEIYKIINNKIINNNSVYPDILKNILYNYQAIWINDGFYYKNIKLKLDFTKNYEEDLIIHNDCGRDNNGLNMLSLLKINDWLINIIDSRYNLIEKPYISIHIRNTDYKSDYINLYNEHNDIIDNNNIFLATDSKETLIFFKNLKLNKNFYTFIECLDEENRPIHKRITINNKKQVVIDTICDLIILSLAEKIIYPKKHYGFTNLAYLLHKNKNIVYNLIKNNE